MRRSVFSPSWHQVAELRPRLLPHARIHSHTYRGQNWFVLQDPASARHHRLTPAAYAFVRGMDGRRTVQALWDEACRCSGDHIPAQEEIVELLMQLHAQDLLYCDITPDAAELFERYRKHRSKKWKQWLLNPMSLRVPLLDPDAFLTRTVHRFSWAFGAWGALLWFVAVVPAFILAGQHWSELTENLSDRVMSAQNLLLLALVFPVVKALHELGHGFAAKAYGAAVNEMGIMFLVFAPVPYVDASATSAFRFKRQRAVVGAAGMLVEVLLAALAVYVWVLVEPGLVRSLAYNVMLIAGISTVIVNGNPLLRYDGYYILADLIEMPNLAQRGQRYYTYLCDRYLFGARDIEPPAETPAEKRWLLAYTPTSWLYRMFIMISIILFVAGEFFIVGVLLALWSATTLLIVPLWKAGKHVFTSPGLHRQRGRAIKMSLGFVAGVAFLVAVVPVPLRTDAEGVVWLPDQAILRAGNAGFFQRWLVEPGTYVQADTPVLVMDEPLLEAQLAAARARVAEAEVRYRAAQFTEPARAEIARQQLEHEQQVLARAEERHTRFIVRSAASGVLTVAVPQDMEDQYFKQGDVLGYVLEHRALIARVVVPQEDIDLVRTHLRSVELRFADAIPETYPVTILREVPGGVDKLPTAALSHVGGGRIAVDPQDPDGLKTLERHFLFDLNLPGGTSPSAFGGRVYARFDHIPEPLASQWYRYLRQLFLSRFHV